MSTVFEDAFKSAGFGPEAVQFLTAYARLLNNGGSREEANSLLDFADRQNLPGRGHRGHADEGRLTPAPSRQPDGDGEGQRCLSQKGQDNHAPSSPPVGGAGGHIGRARGGLRSISSPPSPQHAGQTIRANRAIPDVPASGAGAGHRYGANKAISAMPAPRPMSQARVEAAKSVRQQQARDFWDTEIGGVKRKLGNLTQFDVRQIKRRALIDGHISDRLLLEIEWPDEDTTTLKDCASEVHVRSIINEAHKRLETANV